MSSWIGNVIGSAIGLVAILLGALWNARLTRKRDMLVMNEEAKSIAAAIGAEMGVYAELMCGRMSQAQIGPEGRTAGIVRSLLAPQPVVWPALASRVGLLGAELSAKTVRSWSLLALHAQLLEASVVDMQSGEWSETAMRSRCEIVKMDMPGILDAVEALTGQRPDLAGMLP